MLIESCILLATLVSPEDFGLPPPYPSGIYDNGDFSVNDPPAADYPLLRIPSQIKLSKKITLPSGTYAVKNSTDEKNIILTQGHGDIYVLPISENTIIDTYCEKPITSIKIEPDKVIITYHRENIFKKAVLPIKQDF
jgi:hypothetical protein